MSDLFGYAGKTVVINGAASGIGLATTRLLLDLGATVFALDRNDVPVAVDEFIRVDLANEQSIDRALGQLPARIDRLFCCAGVIPPTPGRDIVLTNFVGQRRMIESVLSRMSEGDAVAVISSRGGAGWMRNFAALRPMLSASTFAEACVWLDAHPELIVGIDAYRLSKECLTAYVKMRAVELVSRKIRINAISPSTTNTPMLDIVLSTGVLGGAPPISDRYATPEEMAQPLVFLNSNMATFISGADLHVDNALMAARALDRLTRQTPQ